MSEAQYWAKIDENNRVVNVEVVTREYMDSHPEMYDGQWVQTFFDTEGKTFAGIDYTYNLEIDDFTPPEPNEHWKTLVGWVE